MSDDKMKKLWTESYMNLYESYKYNLILKSLKIIQNIDKNDNRQEGVSVLQYF